ncbi:MAG TPA: hypothetical protein DCM10_08815, partial [Xanthomarina gelatinilytica]|nr:hypothetical protein [Xanthomarina gelatinilytica]
MENKMKYLLTVLMLASTISVANADQPERKVISPPNVVRSQPRDFTRPPAARPQIPGKQQWQKPQQPQQPKVEKKHSFGFYNYYYTPNPYFNRYYRVPTYRPPVIIQPPVIVQPQPMPIYPGPFHGFFFHF